MSKVNIQYLVDSVERAKAATVVMEPMEGIQGYSIVSFTNDSKRYKVSLRKRVVAGTSAIYVYGCDCPHFEHRRLICKHMIAVSINENIDIIQLHRDAIAKVNKEYKAKGKNKQTAVSGIDKMVQ